MKACKRQMNNLWLSRVIPIALIFSFRMLGLFMLIPVFTLYALKLDYATPVLIGLALGGYGLTQGVLQIPFGYLSDKFGRKPMITIGLTLFILGSLIGAYTQSIYGMILARLLQGMGAIGSVLIALLSDLTPEDRLTSAMAVVGVSIGFSVSLAMVASPIIAYYTQLQGIFIGTAILGVLGLLILYFIVPTPQQSVALIDSDKGLEAFKKAITHKFLLSLDAGICIQHFVLTATFYVIPLLLKDFILMGHLDRQWQFYLPLMIFSFLAMVPLIGLAERKNKMRPIFNLAILVMVIAQWGLAYESNHWLGFCSLMFIYFVAFNFLEASLPSLVSKAANPRNKGTAMGIYSSAQFLGIFLGGLFAGIIYQFGKGQQVFLVNGLICLVWLLFNVMMPKRDFMSK